MLDLFDNPIAPDGFSYYPDFLTELEEELLIDVARSLELRPLIFQGFEAKRKVASFGYDYNFDKRTITKGVEIPQDFDFLLNKVADWLAMPAQEFAELLVTEYPKNSVINWHRDAPPFDMIIGISLMSDCNLKLRPYDKAKQNRQSVITIPVRRRSIYVLKGEVRSEWEHSIMPVKETRYSVTLRTLK